MTDCEKLGSIRFDGVLVSSATEVTDREDLPAFCAVRGTIEPNIGFEARLPLTGWNGKFYQSGCGGYCGAVLPDKKGYSNTINQALLLGFAAITTDAGHTGGLGDASWALNDPVAVEMYAHRSIPLTHRAGTALVTAFYDREPDRDYFGGCSNGGRMAAMAAQRYPILFDGILGGGAVLNLSQNGGIYGSWIVQSNTGPDGARILDYANFAHKLPALHTAVVAQCDGKDGQLDGVVTLPRNCSVDVSALPACPGEGPEACLDETEREVLRKWYRGPVNSAGESLYPGMPAGSELYWAVWFMDREGRVAPGNALGGDYARYLGFEDGVPDGYTALDFDFDRDPVRLEATGRMLDALDPDLEPFAAAGGKFLMWHGWQDPLVLPDQSVAYHEAVVETLGGADRVDPFFRLFMIPGQGHCWELPSDAPDRFDPIWVLDRWVETGQPPEELTVRSLDPDSTDLDTAVICPWPGEVFYFESGPDDAAARCAAPAR